MTEQLPDFVMIAALEAQIREVVQVDFLIADLNAHRHCDMLEPIYESLPDILEVVIAKNEVDSAVQTVNNLIPLFSSTETEVSEMEDYIIRPNHPVPVSDYGLVHLADIFERAVAILQYVGMIEMCVGSEEQPVPSNLKFIVIDFYYGIPAEIGLLTMKSVTKLIADAPGIADGFIYVSMRVTVYPVFDMVAGDKVAKFGCKGPVYRATLEFVCHKLERRHMVCGDYNVLGLTLRHTSLDELTATLMLLIETLGGETELSVAYAMEVGHSAFGLIFIPRVNLCPQS